jgi:c-di-GMP-binding flagellar brake protein YcgR
MSLISVARDELTIGQPLLWVLYDHQRNVLMDRGMVIADAAQLSSLLERKPLRELALHAGQDKSVANQTPPAEATKAETTFSFLDMKLKVGDRIQLQPPASMGPERYVVKLIGYVDNVSVLVTPPLANGMRVPVREGDNIVARVFTSQTAFGFNSTIERVCKIPYDYLHLSFPGVVQGAVIRKSPRIKTHIIVSIAMSDAADGDARMSGIIVNLSANGALLCTAKPLDKKSQEVTLSFRISLHDVDAHLNIKAIIRNVHADDEKDKADPLKYQHGVQFLNLQPTENMILQSLIYQQMIEQPHTVT